jgi:hypothetical protein
MIQKTLANVPPRIVSLWHIFNLKKMLELVKFIFSLDCGIAVDRVTTSYFGNIITRKEVEGNMEYLVELDLIDLRTLDNKFKLLDHEEGKYKGYKVLRAES